MKNSLIIPFTYLKMRPTANDTIINSTTRCAGHVMIQLKAHVHRPLKAGGSIQNVSDAMYVLSLSSLQCHYDFPSNKVLYRYADVPLPMFTTCLNVVSIVRPTSDNSKDNATLEPRKEEPNSVVSSNNNITTHHPPHYQFTSLCFHNTQFLFTFTFTNEHDMCDQWWSLLLLFMMWIVYAHFLWNDHE